MFFMITLFTFKQVVWQNNQIMFFYSSDIEAEKKLVIDFHHDLDIARGTNYGDINTAYDATIGMYDEMAR